MSSFAVLSDRAATIFALADQMKVLSTTPPTDSLVIVKKTCLNCGTHYDVWDKEDCDGETALGLWYTCRARKESGEICGSTLLHLSEAQKKKLKAYKLTKKGTKHA